MKCHLLFSILCFGGILQVEGFSPFYSVFQSCYNSSALGYGPTFSSVNQTITITTTLLNLLYNGSVSYVDAFEVCLDDVLHNEENSIDSTLWFFANAFHKDVLNMTAQSSIKAVAHLKDVSGLALDSDLTCEEFIWESGFFEGCLDNITTLVNDMRSNGNPTFDEVCSAVGNYTCITDPNMLTNQNCSEMHIELISASYGLYSGFCNHLVNGMSYPQPEPPYDGTYTDSSGNGYHDGDTGSGEMPDTAFLHCGRQILQDVEPSMIFPPSHSMISMIDEMPNAIEEHARSIQKFCWHVTEFSDCFKQSLLNPNSTFDEQLAKLIDPDRISEAFIYYCIDSDIVELYYACALSSIKSGHYCGGGIIDLLMSIDTKLMMEGPKESNTDYLCSLSAQRDQCRVKEKFSSCSSQFADVMQKFYDTLRAPRCQGFTPNSNDIEAESDLAKCVEDYGLGAITRMENMEQEMNNDFNAIIDVFTQEMDTICRLKSQTMGCINNVHSSVNKPVDRLMFKVMIPENIEIVVDEFCAMVPDLKQHAFCLMMNMLQLTTMESRPTCYADLEAEMTLFAELNSDVDTEQEIEAVIEGLCRKIPSVTNCIAGTFANCDSGVASKFEDLGAKVAASCNNPSPISSAQSPLRASVAVSFLILAMSLLKLLV